MTDERRQTLQAWLDEIRRLASEIDSPNLTEENVARGMSRLVDLLSDDQPDDRPEPETPALAIPPTLEQLLEQGLDDEEAASKYDEEQRKFKAGEPPYGPPPAKAPRRRAKS